MGVMTQYALQVALLLCTVYLLYKWLLAGCTFSRFNRIVLLCLYMLSFVAVPLYGLFTGMMVDKVVEPPIEEQVREEVISLSDSAAPSWPVIVGAVYLAGVIVSVALTLGSICRIVKIVRNGTMEKRDNYTLVFTDCRNVSPFSWGRCVVLPADTRQEDIDIILVHEQTHLRLRHWVDLALGQIVIIFNWFNPAAYLMMKELQDVHEFEVDSEVVKGGIDKRQYQMLLIRNVTGTMFPMIVDSLNHSRLKCRLRLMMAPRSNPFRKMTLITFVPLIVAVIWGVNAPVLASGLSSIAGASIFSPRYNEVEYVIDGNHHSIRYSQDGMPVSISMDVEPGALPDIYINRHLASKSRLGTIKSDDVVFVMCDNRNNRFVVKTK